MLPDVQDLQSTSCTKPLMGMRLVLCWVEGVAEAFEVCVDVMPGGEVGGDGWVEGEIGDGS